MRRLVCDWNTLFISVAGTAILGLLGVPITTAACIGFGVKAVKDAVAAK